MCVASVLVHYLRLVYLVCEIRIVWNGMVRTKAECGFSALKAVPSVSTEQNEITSRLQRLYAFETVRWDLR